MTDVSQHGCQTRPIDPAIAFKGRTSSLIKSKVIGITWWRRVAWLKATEPTGHRDGSVNVVGDTRS